MPLGAFQSASFAVTVRSEVNKAFDERLYFTGFALATARGAFGARWVPNCNAVSRSQPNANS